MKDKRLVWSDDPRDQDKVEGRGHKPSAVSSQSLTIPDNWTAVFRLERAGRGGKTVTVIERLPNHETWVSALCKELKAKCGSGGTFEVSGGEGKIEIQGDKRDAIKAIFTKKGYKFKGM